MVCFPAQCQIVVLWLTILMWLEQLPSWMSMPTLMQIYIPSLLTIHQVSRSLVVRRSTCEDWNTFLRHWDTFCIGSGTINVTALSQLLECIIEQLGNVVLRTHPNFIFKTLEDALAVLKSITVIPVAPGVLWSDLAAMRQSPDKLDHTFTARV